MWLVSGFLMFTIYYKARTFSISTINTIELRELSWPNDLKRRSVDSVRWERARFDPQTRTCFFVYVFHFVLHFDLHYEHGTR